MKQLRSISYSFTSFKQIPNNLKGRSKSSQEWLTRQLSDPYVEKAKLLNYRCRSAFKLLEMDARYNLLQPGQCIVDCGAAPGSWSQVAVEKVNSQGNGPGMVIGIDRLPIYPIPGAILMGNCDFTREDNQQKIKEALEGREVDCVLSDMAPNATGIRSLDHEAIIALAYSVIRFAFGVSRIGGNVLVKVWEGGGLKKLEQDLSRFYTSVRIVKPPASRSDSAEKFVLARNFVGIER